MAIIRNRLIPYKLLIYLLYSERDFVVERRNGRTVVLSGPLARELRVSSSRLREALTWLSDTKLIKSYNIIDRGTIEVYLKTVKDYLND